MDDLLQKPAADSLAKQRSISTGRLIYWGLAIATGLLFFFVPWMPGPLVWFAIAYGLDGAVEGRIRMTHESEVRGRRARGLGMAFIALRIAHFALDAFERSPARPFAGLSDVAGFALMAAAYGPLLTLWILGLVWARPLHDSPAGTS